MNSLFLAALSVLACNAIALGSTPEPKPAEKILAQPAMFGEGLISTGDYESHPAFTPDGKTLYFVKSNPTFDFWTIVVSHLVNGKWSAPETAPFSGQYADADPGISGKDPQPAKWFGRYLPD